MRGELETIFESDKHEEDVYGVCAEVALDSNGAPQYVVIVSEHSDDYIELDPEDALVMAMQIIQRLRPGISFH